MKNILYNLGYFIKEAKTLFKIDLLSNVFSIFSIGLVFFILSLVLSGWWTSNYIIEVIEREAEINVYFNNKIKDLELSRVIESINAIEGVNEAKIIHEDEAYNRMVDILGKEAKILELFHDNPFNSFIEVQIQIGEADSIIEELEGLEDVEYIRDNKKVIDRLQNIITILKVLGLLAIIAVGISTLVVISHIIRQGIYNNKEEINTLELLGAPEFFIGFPFLLEGLFLTAMGGVLALIMVNFVIRYGLGQIEKSLTFIPIPSIKILTSNIIAFILSISLILGVVGSIFGLYSARR